MDKKNQPVKNQKETHVMEVWGPKELWDKDKLICTDIERFKEYDKKIDELSIKIRALFKELNVIDKIDITVGAILCQLIGGKKIAIIDVFMYLDTRIDELKTQIDNFHGTIQNIVDRIDTLEQEVTTKKGDKKNG